MKISFICIGKTDNKHLNVLIEDYVSRISRLIKFEMIYIIPSKSIYKLPPAEVKRKEGEMLLQRINESDRVLLLDEKGKRFSSLKFSDFIQIQMNSGIRNLIFVVGGAWGFSEEVYKRANDKISLSDMTTTHQLIRLFFTEQIYRALTILNRHPYHNQ